MRLHKDDLGNVVQAVGLAPTGATQVLTTLANSYAVSSAALTGLYRITTTVDVKLAVGSASANDEPLWAGTETHKYINGQKLAVYATVAAGSVFATLCP